ncbi:MAG: sigma-70 region 4 domain-containing protein [Ruminococcus sp.]|nr:sigma-70 region 4 domain-containing protein [Ruminococcus sp.]
MREKITLTALIGGKADYRDYIGSNSSNIEKLTGMYTFLRKAIKAELTERQSQCLTMSLIEGKTQKEVAEILGVNASTVNRHLAAAKKKLIHSVIYYNGGYR